MREVPCPCRETEIVDPGTKPMPWISNPLAPSPAYWLMTSLGVGLVPVGSVLGGGPGGGAKPPPDVVDCLSEGSTLGPRKAPAATRAAAPTTPAPAIRPIRTRRSPGPGPARAGGAGGGFVAARGGSGVRQLFVAVGEGVGVSAPGLGTGGVAADQAHGRLGHVAVAVVGARR